MVVLGGHECPVCFPHSNFCPFIFSQPSWAHKRAVFRQPDVCIPPLLSCRGKPIVISTVRQIFMWTSSKPGMNMILKVNIVEHPCPAWKQPAIVGQVRTLEYSGRDKSHVAWSPPPINECTIIQHQRYPFWHNALIILAGPHRTTYSTILQGSRTFIDIGHATEAKTSLEAAATA